MVYAHNAIKTNIMTYIDHLNNIHYPRSFLSDVNLLLCVGLYVCNGNTGLLEYSFKCTSHVI